MFNNMKRFISLALPVVAVTMTSCGSAPKTVTYEQIRRYATENYDARALDTVPANFILNLNKCQADVVLNYTTPEGGRDSSTIAFGFNGIHLTFKDQYAIVLSSTLIDSIEKYFSDFTALAISLVDETPIDMCYQLLGNNASMIDITTSEKLVGSVFIKLLQIISGTLDIASSASGYIPSRYVMEYLEEGSNPCTKEPTKTIFEGIMALSMSVANLLTPKGSDPSVVLEKAAKYAMILLEVMNNAAFTVLNSSKAHGETFNTYITTDSYGFINKFDFNFKSSFDVSGLVKYKEYASNEPEEGEQPLPTSPYHFSASGSFDFDIDMSSEFAN